MSGTDIYISLRESNYSRVAGDAIIRGGVVRIRWMAHDSKRTTESDFSEKVGASVIRNINRL